MKSNKNYSIVPISEKEIEGFCSAVNSLAKEKNTWLF
jgi:hypothetical protein